MKIPLALFFSLFALPCFTSPLQAQDFAEFEFFAGFAVQSDEAISELFQQPGLSHLYGWQVGVAQNYTETLGLAADVSGTYRSFGGSTTKNYLFLFGPRFNKRNEGATLFAHTLFGWLRTSDAAIETSTGFAMGFGGGIDGKLTDGLSVRTQVDWIPERTFGEWGLSNFRVGVGLVFHGGQ